MDSDLFRLCDQLKIKVVRVNTTLSVKSFKGFSLVQNRIPVIVLNNKMSEELMKVVLAHEIGHCVLHRDLVALRGFRDFDLFGMTDQCEYEANLFAAELLLDTDEVLKKLDELQSTFDAAKAMYVPKDLLDFKLVSMWDQGFDISPELCSAGDFLRRIED